MANCKYIGVPHFCSVFFEYLYHKYLSENIEQPSDVFFGMDEQLIKKKKKISQIFLIRITKEL
tara:strand:- start:174 stop:362 length:189 start_codon:yes stop_codon:yes gene_type:complete